MKISSWVFIVIGFCLLLIGVGYGFFQQWLPNSRDAASYEDWGRKLKAEEDKMPRAKDRVKDSVEKVAEISDQWQTVVSRKTPPLSVEGGGMSMTYDRYTMTAKSRVFRDSVQRSVNRQLRRGGVTVVSGAYVAEPTDDPHDIMASYYNYPAAGFPVAVFDLGQVAVQGTWAQISDNVRGWSSMPNFLAVADGLQVTGTSPNLTATYNVTVVAFIRGKAMSPDITPRTVVTEDGEPAEAGAGATPSMPTPGGGGAGGSAPGGMNELGVPGKGGR